jgi:CheY-like chemotaxis protein
VSEVGILVIDNDVVSQRALKHILDAEGWQVRIVPTASNALPELASGKWNLAIVNVTLVDVKGPLFAILRDLAQADDEAETAARVEREAQTVVDAVGGVDIRPEPDGASEEPSATSPRTRFRVLFLVPMDQAAKVEPILEEEGLPYSLRPYHLHEFLEKVSELLVESGAMDQPLRGIGNFSGARARRRARTPARDVRRGAMFAPREDYQMTEEEFAEWERQEEEHRKKREKELKEGGYRY